MPGRLYVVSTPIGNLEDITYRAVRILKEVAWIACEDTRTTGHLLHHYGIETKTISYHDHNEAGRAPELLNRLMQGENGALVSDAGTPLLSDPGFRLIRGLVAHGIKIEPIPGAFGDAGGAGGVGAADGSGPFRGIFAAEAGGAETVLEGFREEQATLIFYEAPHRIVDSLADIVATLGDRDVCVARELTKLYEEVLRGKLEVLAQLQARESIRGEFVVLIGKGEEPVGEERPIAEAIEMLVEAGIPRMDAIKTLARERGLSKREVYKLVNLK